MKCVFGPEFSWKLQERWMSIISQVPSVDLEVESRWPGLSQYASTADVILLNPNYFF
jgi:hypothetical protein